MQGILVGLFHLIAKNNLPTQKLFAYASRSHELISGEEIREIFVLCFAPRTFTMEIQQVLHSDNFPKKKTIHDVSVLFLDDFMNGK
jgi:hypothetical protein